MTSTDVHFIWLGGPLPGPHRRELERFRSLNPNLSVRLWDHVPDAMPADLKQVVQDAAPMLCQKADIIRVWLLHAYGGMYFDTDIAWLSSVEPLRQRERFWAARSHQHVSNFALGARPGDPLVTKYLQMIQERAAAGVHHDRACYGPRCIGELVNDGLDVLPQECFDAVTRMPQRLQVWNATDNRRALIERWADCPLNHEVYGLHIGADSRN